MKKYNITVNGKKYEVEVEEVFSTSDVQPSAAAPAPAAPAAAPAPAAGSEGNTVIEAAVPGKVVRIAASVGQSVAEGDPIVVVESMKMEIAVVAPTAGTVASINVAVGDSIESGNKLATLNA